MRAGTDFNRLEYEKRVNRVIDYIGDHLSGELSLAELARVAAFSPFHFHRVFRALTDETLFGYIQRLRIEKAAGALTSRPALSVLEVALDHGFSSAATFARAFRAHFGMSATQWRGAGPIAGGSNGDRSARRANSFAIRAKQGQALGPILLAGAPRRPR